MARGDSTGEEGTRRTLPTVAAPLLFADDAAATANRVSDEVTAVLPFPGQSRGAPLPCPRLDCDRRPTFQTRLQRSLASSWTRRQSLYPSSFPQTRPLAALPFLEAILPSTLPGRGRDCRPAPILEEVTTFHSLTPPPGDLRPLLFPDDPRTPPARFGRGRGRPSSPRTGPRPRSPSPTSEAATADHPFSNVRPAGRPLPLGRRDHWRLPLPPP